MKLFITGINGFAGRHLARLAAERGWQIQGSARPGSSSRLEIAPGCEVETAAWDIAREPFPEGVLGRFQPDAIAHLAAESFAGTGGLGEDSIWQANLFGTRRLYEAIFKTVPGARVLYVGTGLAYGPPPSRGQKSDENHPLCPPNNYAATKSCADLLSYQAFRDPGLAIIRARPFNHIGPGQGRRFAVAAFTSQFAAMKLGLIAKRLEVGNLDSARDFTDVRDIARAYLELILRGRPGEAYNLGSGHPVGMRSVVESLSAITAIEPELVQRTDFLRKFDPPVLLADCSKAHTEIGWKPEIPFMQTIQDTLEYWLNQPAKMLTSP